MSTDSVGNTRAAIYLRVSTGDDEQTEENQRRELKAFLEEGYILEEEYVDHESGRKGRKERAAFNEMFEAAENREFDVLVFWSLDRFSREGIHKTICYLQQLDSLGIGFRSYIEPYLNTDHGLVSKILLSVLSYFAEYESKKIFLRTKAGIEQAREEGKQFGRPSKFEKYLGEIEDMIEEGASKAEMNRRTDLAYGTVSRYVERHEDGPLKGHRRRESRNIPWGGWADQSALTPAGTQAPYKPTRLRSDTSRPGRATPGGEKSSRRYDPGVGVSHRYTSPSTTHLSGHARLRKRRHSVGARRSDSDSRHARRGHSSVFPS